MMKWLGDVGTTQNGRSKPMEDVALADDVIQFYIVCDGITRMQKPYPDPSPAAEAAQEFAENVHNNMKVQRVHYRDKEGSQKLRAAFRQADFALQEMNEELYGKDLSGVDYGANDLVGLVALAVYLEGNLLHYAYCGDCCGYLIRNGKTFRFGGWGGHARAYLDLYEWEGEDRWRWSREHLRNNPNHPGGYPAITGEGPIFERFVQHGTMELVGDERIVIATDGYQSVFAKHPSVLLDNLTADGMSADAIKHQEKADDRAVIVIRGKQ